MLLVGTRRVPLCAHACASARMCACVEADADMCAADGHVHERACMRTCVSVAGWLRKSRAAVGRAMLQVGRGRCLDIEHFCAQLRCQLTQERRKACAAHALHRLVSGGQRARPGCAPCSGGAVRQTRRRCAASSPSHTRRPIRFRICRTPTRRRSSAQSTVHSRQGGTRVVYEYFLGTLLGVW